VALWLRWWGSEEVIATPKFYAVGKLSENFLLTKFLCPRMQNLQPENSNFGEIWCKWKFQEPKIGNV